MIWKLFFFFLKLGAVCFGGGYPLLSMIMMEGESAVELTATEIADMMALQMMASGPIAINSATYIGYIKGGILGAIISTVAVILPGSILSLLLYETLKRHSNRFVKGFVDAIVMACGGLILSTAIRLGINLLILTDTIQETVQAPLLAFDWLGILIVAVCFLCLRWLKLNPIPVIGIAAVMGALLMW